MPLSLSDTALLLWAYHRTCCGCNQIDQLENTAEPTWEGVVEPLERLTDRLGVAWGTVSHLKAVRDSTELREAIEVSFAPDCAAPALCAQWTASMTALLCASRRELVMHRAWK